MSYVATYSDARELFIEKTFIKMYYTKLYELYKNHKHHPIVEHIMDNSGHENDHWLSTEETRSIVVCWLEKNYENFDTIVSVIML